MDRQAMVAGRAEAKERRALIASAIAKGRIGLEEVLEYAQRVPAVAVMRLDTVLQMYNSAAIRQAPTGAPMKRDPNENRKEPFPVTRRRRAAIVRAAGAPTPQRCTLGWVCRTPERQRRILNLYFERNGLAPWAGYPWVPPPVSGAVRDVVRDDWWEA